MMTLNSTGTLVRGWLIAGTTGALLVAPRVWAQEPVAPAASSAGAPAPAPPPANPAQTTGQSQSERGIPHPGEAGMQSPVVLGAPQPLPASGQFPRVEAHADLQNLVLWRNDSDVDRTKPIYNQNGQSVGAFATVFRPKLTFHIDANLRLYYEAELGLNFWSKQNPDQQDPKASDVFVLKHREVYTEGELSGGKFGFKVGYQYFRDTTALFLGHWIGAANVWYSWAPSARLGAFLGQIPDVTYEGVNVQDNNLRRDIFVFGPRLDLKLGERAAIAVGLTGLYDNHVVDRALWLMVPNAQFDFKSGPMSASLGGVVQTGRQQNAALGGKDQNIFAWAAQAHGAYVTDKFELDLNVLALSPDDDKDNNTRSGTFRYSSKSRSATIILTEDEVRNWYDQLDRRMGRYEGGFWQHRAGLGVGDLKSTLVVTKVFRPALIVGAGTVLEPSNALGNRFVGVETDLNLEFRASEHLRANLVGGALWPGRAAGALLNKIDLGAHDPIYMIEGSLMARY